MIKKLATIFPFLTLIIAVSAAPVSAAPDALRPLNPSFESWSTTTEGTMTPTNWIIQQANDPKKAIVRSSDALEGKYSLQLMGIITNPGGTDPGVESTNPKATQISTDEPIYLSSPYNLPRDLKLIVWVKPLTNLAETRGKIELLHYGVGPSCTEKFAIPQTVTTWTKLTLNCPNRMFKTGIVITQNSIKPALYDKVSINEIF